MGTNDKITDYEDTLNDTEDAIRNDHLDYSEPESAEMNSDLHEDSDSLDIPHLPEHYVDIQPWYRLCLDKISLTWSEPNPGNVDGACYRIHDLKERYRLNIKRRGRYAVGCSFGVPFEHPVPSQVFFQAFPTAPGMADYRLEFNPAKIGPLGLHDLYQFLRQVIGPDADDFLRNGRVTRIDVALDLPGLTLEKVIVRRNRVRVVGMYSNQFGECESVYLGGKQSDRTVCYTSKTEGALRIERRIKRPGCRGSGLATFPNPFANVEVIDTAELRQVITEVPPDMFFDSARVRGVNRALKLLSPRQATLINAVMADPAASVMPSLDEIWSEWPQALYETGLGSYIHSGSSPRRTIKRAGVDIPIDYDRRFGSAQEAQKFIQDHLKSTGEV